MLYESCLFVSNGRSIMFGFGASERSAMADALRKDGPEAILEIVYLMEFRPEEANINREEDRSNLVAAIADFASHCGGVEKLDLKLRDRTRRTYASTIEAEFEHRWALMDASSSSSASSASSSSSSASASSSANLEQQWEVLDLGHQLACLWAMTDAQDKSEAIFRRVLGRLKTISPLPTSDASKRHVARLDRTAAKLVELLRSRAAPGCNRRQILSRSKRAAAASCLYLGREFPWSFCAAFWRSTGRP